MLIKSIQGPSCGGNLNVENIHQSLDWRRSISRCEEAMARNEVQDTYRTF